MEQGSEVLITQLSSPFMLVLIFMLLENSWHLAKINLGMKSRRCFHFILRYLLGGLVVKIRRSHFILRQMGPSKTSFHIWPEQRLCTGSTLLSNREWALNYGYLRHTIRREHVSRQVSLHKHCAFPKCNDHPLHSTIFLLLQTNPQGSRRGPSKPRVVPY